jgi:hypothetical protein
MTNQHFQKKPLFELPHRIGVVDACGVHLEDEIVEFAFHSLGFLCLA